MVNYDYDDMVDKCGFICLGKVQVRSEGGSRAVEVEVEGTVLRMFLVFIEYCWWV